MRHLAPGLASLAAGCLAIASAAGAAFAAGACYLPVEIEADQAIRLRVELKIVGDLCRDRSYEIFSDRNRDTLAAYEQILGEHLARGAAGPGEAASDFPSSSLSNSDVAAYVRGLEKTAGEIAAQSANFCAEAFDTMALFGGMRPADLLAYAAAKADAVKQDYALCTAPALPEVPDPPARVVPTNARAEPTPPARPAESKAEPPTPLALPAERKAVGPTALFQPAERRGEAPLSVGDTPLARLLTAADRQLLRDATQQTLETVRSGQVVGWRGGSNSGTVVADRPFINVQSQWCRRFQQQILLEGAMQRGDGVACRRPDGFWEIAPQQ
jgi:hypothetical protein